MNRQILFFYTTNNIGGAETNIIKITRELVLKGYNIHLAFLNEEGPLLELIDFQVCSITYIKDFRKHPIYAYKKYKQLITVKKIDIVFNFGLKVECFSRILSKKFGVKKVVSNIRSTDDHRKWYHTLLDRLTQYNVDLWVSNSEAGKLAHHKREKVPIEKILVINNFIENVTIIPKKMSDILRIGTLANIFPYKGYFDMIPLAKLLLEKKMIFKFIIGGVDKTNGFFIKKIKSESLENFFEFKGYVSDKAAFFSEIDVFFLPSYLEGFPTVLLESMIYETPIIASNVGGIPEIIQDKKTGFIYSPGDIVGYADGLNLFTNEEKRFKFAKEANIYVKEKFSKDICIKRWIDIINN